MTVQMFYNLQNHPIFHSEERLVNLARRRECLVGLSILLVYAQDILIVIRRQLLSEPVYNNCLPHYDTSNEKKTSLFSYFLQKFNIS